MTEPTHIHAKKFKAAKGEREQSKYSVMHENEQLRAKNVSLAQLLAAVLMEIPEDTSALTFRVDDLEQIHPQTVSVEIKDGIVTVCLVDPPDDGGGGERKVA